MSNGACGDKAIYQPLAQTKRGIRLVRIPREQTSTVTCQIAIFSLDDLPKYYALSYAWTDEHPSCQIELNGRAFAVRPNLYNYLRLVSEDDQEPAWIFIDAICIDQQNMNERSAQVSLMGSIYYGAEKVVAWLGIDNEFDSDESYIWDKFGQSEHALEAYFDKEANPTVQFEAKRNALRPILSWEYWSRLWIVQEVSLAQKLIFQQGRTVIRFEILYRYLQLFMKALGITPSDLQQSLVYTESHAADSSHDKFSVVLMIAYQILAQRAFIHSKPRAPKQIDLSAAVIRFSHQRCRWPYDKIFGLLGLTESRMPVHYEMPKMELYLRALIEGCLELERRLLRDDGLTASLLSVVYPFAIHLMMALRLSASDPTLRLITNEVFRLWGAPLHTKRKSELERLFGVMTNQRYSHNPIEWRVTAWTQYARTRMILRVARCRSNRMLSSPDGGPSRSARGWEQLASEIFCEVKRDLPRCDIVGDGESIKNHLIQL